MIKIAVVGTGKLGSTLMKSIQKREGVSLSNVIARPGNSFVGGDVSQIIGGADTGLIVLDDIEAAGDCDIFIDCTSAAAFMENNLPKYKLKGRPLVIATTAFSDDDMEAIREYAQQHPVFMTGNFSVALHDFIEVIRFAAKKLGSDTDVQIIEYHHNQKKDAPSGTALMIRDALVESNPLFTPENVDISSVRGGNIFGEHEVIFANSKDEVTTFKHQVSSRETFAEGGVDVTCWLVTRENGLYSMDDFCK